MTTARATKQEWPRKRQQEMEGGEIISIKRGGGGGWSDLSYTQSMAYIHQQEADTRRAVNIDTKMLEISIDHELTTQHYKIFHNQRTEQDTIGSDSKHNWSVQVLQIIKCDRIICKETRQVMSWVVERDSELSLNRGWRGHIISVFFGRHLVLGNVESFVDDLWYRFDLRA